MLVPDSNFIKVEKSSLPIPVAILGSTGSIGCSALEVIRAHAEMFEVVALAAGQNGEKLLEQVREFKPRYAALGDTTAAKAAARSCAAASPNTEFLSGEEGVASLAAIPETKVVLAAIVGFAGLKSVLKALSSGKRVALANKESLVCAGGLVSDLIAQGLGSIVPVDSEHSAIFQALQGQSFENVSSLILTASGGPFLRTPIENLRDVNPAQALQHPNWKMGAKVTVDSATMMNKALELIEAFWLFGVSADRIEVVVHPQSIVHSLVRFVDGVQLAQLSVPDMKGPISYALTYPAGRLGGVMASLDLAAAGKLEFLPLDHQKFPAVALARDCVSAGGAAPAVMNIANEVAVAAFLRRELPFLSIVKFVSEAVTKHGANSFSNFDELAALVEETRAKLIPAARL